MLCSRQQCIDDQYTGGKLVISSQVRSHKLSAYLGPASFHDSQTQVDVSAIPFNADRSEVTVNGIDLIVHTEYTFLQTNSRLRLDPSLSRAGTLT